MSSFDKTVILRRKKLQIFHRTPQKKTPWKHLVVFILRSHPEKLSILLYTQMPRNCNSILFFPTKWTKDLEAKPKGFISQYFVIEMVLKISSYMLSKVAESWSRKNRRKTTFYCRICFFSESYCQLNRSSYRVLPTVHFYVYILMCV